jgi:uncharacterized protein (DUF58 family)
MTRRFTAKYYVYLLVWACSIGMAAATGAPEPLLVGAPFFAALLAGVLPKSAPKVVAERDPGVMEVFENAPVSSRFTLHAKTDLALVEAVWTLPSDARLLEGTNTVVSSIPTGGSKQYQFTYRLPSRRVSDSGELIIRVADETGFTRWEERLPAGPKRTVFPASESVRYLLRPENTRVFAGSYPSPRTGEGLEFADVRPFTQFDSTSRINWRALARTGELYVNDYVTERNTDVVLLLDVFADPGERGASLLDYETRAAATVSEYYLREKNRVGLVEFGSYLRYLLPAPGRKAWYRILSTLSAARTATGYVSHEVSHIPPRVLPPQSLVVALTGLVDARFGDALGDLKARGFDVAVIHVSPPSLPRDESAFGSVLERAAAVALWELRDRRRATSLAAAGIDVATWDVAEPIAAVIRRLDAQRRGRRRQW